MISRQGHDKNHKSTTCGECRRRALRSFLVFVPGYHVLVSDMYPGTHRQSRGTSQAGEGTNLGSSFFQRFAIRCQHSSLDVDSLHRQPPSSLPALDLALLPRSKNRSLILVPGSAHVFLSTYVLGLNAADLQHASHLGLTPRRLPPCQQFSGTVTTPGTHTPLTRHPNQQTTERWWAPPTSLLTCHPNARRSRSGPPPPPRLLIPMPCLGPEPTATIYQVAAASR